MAARRVLVSLSRNPFYNLAFEDWLHAQGVARNSPLLYVYVNSKSVVVGISQHTFIEADVPLLENCGVNLLRRRSGGGAVYHDHGNINFSYHTHRDEYDKLAFSNMLANWLNQAFGSSIRVNEKRSDLFVGDKKVSGSAFKLSGQAAYHHCTLLVNSDLQELGGVLRSPILDRFSDVKGVQSVRSPVTTLADQATIPSLADVHELVGSPQLDLAPLQRSLVGSQAVTPTTATKVDVPSVVGVVARGFMQAHDIDADISYINPEEYMKSDANMMKRVDELMSDGWRWQRNPQCTYTEQLQFPWGSVTFRAQMRRDTVQKMEIIPSENDTGLKTNPLPFFTPQENVPYTKDHVADAVTQGFRFVCVRVAAIRDAVRRLPIFCWPHPTQSSR